MKKNKLTVEISRKTIVFAILLLVGLLALWKASGILVGIFVAFIIMTALNPAVSRMQRWGIRRGISGMILLLAIFILLIAGLVVLTPAVVEQMSLLFVKLPEQIKGLRIDNLDLSFLSTQIAAIPGNAFKIGSAIIGNAVAVFAVFVISYYLLQYRKRLPKFLKWIVGSEEEAENLLNTVENKLGSWIRGQLLLCLVVGLMEFVGLLILGIPFAGPLAIIGGILEIVPNLGPTLSMIPAAILGFTLSSWQGTGVIILYFIVQQIENNFIVPQIMKRVVGLNSLVTLISLMIGYKLGGILGASLAIPLMLTIRIILPFFSNRYKRLGVN